MNINFDHSHLAETKKASEELKEFTDFFIRIGTGQIDIAKDEPHFVYMLKKLVKVNDQLEFFHDKMEFAINNEQPQNVVTHEN